MIAHRLLLPCLGLFVCSTAYAQFDDDEFAPGLIVEYRDFSGNTISRVDHSIMFAGQPEGISRWVEPRTMEAKWRGYVMSQATGDYQLHVYFSGRLNIRLRDEMVLEGEHDSPAWLSSSALPLSFDFHSLEVNYKATSDDATLKLCWSGPQFQPEPITQQYLFHDGDAVVDTRVERGATLVAALRCAACHEIPGEPLPARAPALDQVAGNLFQEWVVGRLGSNQPASADPSRRMPHFAMPRADAEAITAYLFSPSKATQTRRSDGRKRDAKKGQELLLTLGCLACHRVGELGQAALFGGGDLTEIAAKRPPDFFEAWLAAPEKLNRDHRMPVFELTTEQRRNLAAHLATLGTSAATASNKPSGEQIRIGKRLFAEHRCGACHHVEDSTQAAQLLPLRLGGPGDSCLDATASSNHQPKYQLTADEREAVQRFLARAKSQPSTTQERGGEFLLAEHNCLACHRRGTSLGLADQLPAVAAAHEELAELLPAMTPPPLISAGDKLRKQAIQDAIQRKSRHRDYLRVKMPKFPLSEDELKALTQYFIGADRIPPREQRQPAATDPRVLHAVGSRLVTAGGFGCTSCHQVGQAQPSKAPLNARGPRLTMLGDRIRREWFDRFVRNPLRVIPRMEMPSVQVAVGGLMNDDLPAQLAAVWDVLNTPGFEPPPPDPVRIVRRAGIMDRREGSAVVSDVVRVGKRTFIKPLLIGLPNRHNMLFDLEAASLARWSIGDLAQQQTEGKTWYWAAAGNELLATNLSEPEIQLVSNAGTASPRMTGQFPTEFDEFFHTAEGFGFRHRLRFPDDAQLMLKQQFEPLWPVGTAAPSGVERTLLIDGVPPGSKVHLQLTASDLSASHLAADARALATPFGTIRVAAPRDARIAADHSLTLGPSDSGQVRVVLRYTTDLPVDQFAAVMPTPPAPAAARLDMVRGFECERLPLSDEFMPTALAWRANGDLVVASLKGRVWIIKDTNGDGLADDPRAVTDELAAPYGLVVRGHAIDVATKYGVLRLLDEDSQGHFRRTVTIASGWGHTADYHDWAVGLPRDEMGNYYLALPCQQDDRSPAAARWRGTVVKLIRREPSPEDPRLFAIEELSAGHRFPMGIARNRAGELFVTDNQGNYNPFNELNHVVSGRRFGFINRLDRVPGFNPPLTAPAIDIPHPWTRSVNGICFLETPDALRQNGYEGFGPFEGHLIGCEYDTRRLIRMSLQKVGDTYQGAAYPFSFDTPPTGPSFLGPLVCAVAPTGELYVGGLRDSGWGGANNVGEIVRIRPNLAELPCGIREVRATGDGFLIEFTSPVDARAAVDPANYSIASYTRISTPAYGGDDVERRQEKIRDIAMFEGDRTVRVQLPELRVGFVYEFHLKGAIGGGELFPAEAHYTLRIIP